MIGSIWLEEIDKGLIEFIKANVKYDYGKGLEPIKVIPSTPDNDLIQRELPCISLFSYNERPTTKRDTTNFVRHYEPSNQSYYDLGKPRKFDVSYQIDIWSEYHSDINDLTLQWSRALQKHTNLPVIDTVGDKTTTLMTRKGFIRLDEQEGEKRIFRRAYTYTINAVVNDVIDTTKKGKTPVEDIKITRKGD